MHNADLQDVSICRLDAAHLDALYEIELASFSHPWRKEDYRHELAENPLAHYYGCFAEGRMVAYAGFWQVVDEAHITNVAVCPEMRRRQLGALLVQHVKNAALAQGLVRMTLEVRESNTPALALYQKMGFVSAGKRPGYYDEPKEAAIIMWCDLLPAQTEE